MDVLVGVRERAWVSEVMTWIEKRDYGNAPQFCKFCYKATKERNDTFVSSFLVSFDAC